MLVHKNGEKGVFFFTKAAVARPAQKGVFLKDWSQNGVGLNTTKSRYACPCIMGWCSPVGGILYRPETAVTSYRGPHCRNCVPV